MKVDEQTINMSMEAQFYEARRRQNVLERRHSLRTDTEIDKQTRKSEYQILWMPIRVLLEEDKRGRCTCPPMHRIKLSSNDRSLYQRDRDIYPRPLPLITNFRRHIRRAKLPNRFSSIDYLQQW